MGIRVKAEFKKAHKTAAPRFKRIVLNGSGMLYLATAFHCAHAVEPCSQLGRASALVTAGGRHPPIALTFPAIVFFADGR